MSPLLLTIEVRRNAGVWFCAFAVIVTALLFWLGAQSGVMLWRENSIALLTAVSLVGPLFGGVAAWTAARNRRRGIEDLIETTPRPALARELTTWAAPATWAVLACILIGAVIFVPTYLRATWGSPLIWPVIHSLLAIMAYAATGYAFGAIVPERGTPPFVVILQFFATLILSFIDSTRYLSIYPAVLPSTWYDIRPNFEFPRALFLGGVTGLGLGALALKHWERRLAARGFFTAAAVLTIGSAAVLFNEAPTWNGSWQPYPFRWEQLESGDFQRLAFIPYEPVCNNAPLPVCVHPAYQSILGDVSDMVNQVAEPLIGLPGVPTRAEQYAFAHTLPSPEGVVGLNLGDFPDKRFLPGWIASELVLDGTIQVWLLQRAGFESMCERGIPPSGDLDDGGRAICEAAERFATLDLAEQRTWLKENYAALSVGSIMPDDIPGGES